MKLITSDKERIEKIIEILPEDNFDYFLNMRLYNARYTDGQMEMVRTYSEFSSKIFSQFSDERLREVKECFDISFKNLVNFMVHNFFRMNYKEDIFILYPDQKNSPEPKDQIFWQEKLNQLHKLIDDVNDKYKDLFLEMKKYMENNENFKQSHFQINGSQVHFGSGNNVINNKTSKDANKWWEKTWIQLVALFSAILGIISFYIY